MTTGKRRHSDDVLSRVHTLWRREMTGRDTASLHAMSGHERRAHFELIVLNPIMTHDMPGLLLNLNDAEDINGLRVSPEEHWVRPEIEVSWKGQVFAAKATVPDSNIVIKMIRKAIPRALHRYNVDAMTDIRGLSKAAVEELRVDIAWNKETDKLELQCENIRTIDNLRSLAPAFRVMSSIVFRDAWLLRLQELQQPSWTTEFLSKKGVRQLRYKIWNAPNERDWLIVQLTSPYTGIGTDDHGYVFIHTDTSNTESEVEYWRERFRALETNTDFYQLVQPFEMDTAYSSFVSLKIQNYDTHADVARVMVALRFLLS